MDTNEKAPVHTEGQSDHKKNHYGKKRHHHKRGRSSDHRGDNPTSQQISELIAAAEADMASEQGIVAEGAESGSRQAPRKKQPRPARADQRGHQSKANRGGGKEDEVSRAGESPKSEQKNGAVKPDRPAQRPQRPRMTPMPKKQADLPQMDNLLIEDCPEEMVDITGNATDTAELERILRYDIFAKPEYTVPEVIPEGKVVITGVRFRTGGKTYFFDPGRISCTVGGHAIVETARGIEFGEVCIGNRLVDESLVVPPLRPVVRMATPEDIEQNRLNHEREEEAFRIGKEKIAEHGLDMKLVSVQYTFDNSKLLFYFTSDGRVDFRELVKDLAGVFHIRIELRQIGIRDEARMLGGLGACGRPLCCATFLSDFGQVSMKMAKEQNLSLNSTKISGCCGRLMCCLRYEHETYAEALRELPSPGTFVNTPDGPGIVTEVIPLAEQVKVSLRNDSDAAPKKYGKDDISVPRKSSRSEGVAEEALPAEETTEPDTDE